MTTPTVPDFGEPIVVSPATDSVIRDRDGMTVGAVMPSSRVPISRIIACVNACQGIPTDRLQPGSVKRLVEEAESSVAVGKLNAEYDPELEAALARGRELERMVAEAVALARTPYHSPAIDREFAEGVDAGYFHAMDRILSILQPQEPTP